MRKAGHTDAIPLVCDQKYFFQRDLWHKNFPTEAFDCQYFIVLSVPNRTVCDPPCSQQEDPVKLLVNSLDPVDIAGIPEVHQFSPVYSMTVREG